MSEFYEEFGATCETFNLTLDEALKNEVGLVQGKRLKLRLSSLALADEDLSPTTSNDNEYVKSTMETDSGDVTHVIKLNFRVHKTDPPVTQAPLTERKRNFNLHRDDAEYQYLFAEMERAFTAFCLHFRIQFLPNRGSRNEDVFENLGSIQYMNSCNFRQVANGQQETNGGGKSQDKNNTANPSSVQKKNTSAYGTPNPVVGASGGDKPPERGGNSTTTDTDITSTSETTISESGLVETTAESDDTVRAQKKQYVSKQRMADVSKAIARQNPNKLPLSAKDMRRKPKPDPDRVAKPKSKRSSSVHESSSSSSNISVQIHHASEDVSKQRLVGAKKVLPGQAPQQLQLSAKDIKRKPKSLPANDAKNKIKDSNVLGSTSSSSSITVKSHYASEDVSKQRFVDTKKSTPGQISQQAPLLVKDKRTKNKSLHHKRPRKRRHSNDTDNLPPHDEYGEYDELTYEVPDDTLQRKKSRKRSRRRRRRNRKLEKEADNATSKDVVSFDRRATMAVNKRKSILAAPPRLVASVEDIQTFNMHEKDNEWLEWSSTEDENIDEDQQDEDNRRAAIKTKQTQVDPDLQEFLHSTRLLNFLMSTCWLDPYQRVVRSNKCVHVKWDGKSVEFLRVCCSSLLFFLITLSTFFSLMFAANYEDTEVSSDRILATDYANHLIEAYFFLFLTLYLSIYNFSCLMEVGLHYAGYMSRFNLAICLLKYDVSKQIHAMIVKHCSGVLLFSLGLTALFFGGRTTVPSWRDACGFIGYAIVRPIDFKVRESIYYPLVEILGLVVFLYVFLCFNVVILQFAVYAKALENMAKRFNLRLVYRLGKVYYRTVKGNVTQAKKVIPYKKLHAEHLIITSLSKQMSQVNQVAFDGLLFMVFLQIILFCWIIFDIFIIEAREELVDENNKILEVGLVDLSVPLRKRELPTEVFVKSAIVVLLISCGFLKFGSVMHNAGATIHLGMEYIRRHGVILCQTSKERRFILSLMTSFTPKTTFWIGKHFELHRAFLVGFTAFATGVAMVFITFSAKRLELAKVRHCDNFDNCIEIRITKDKLHKLYSDFEVTFKQDGSVDPVKQNPLSGTTKMSSFNENTSVTLNHNPNPPIFLDNPTCLSNGAYPFRNSSGHVEACTSNWTKPLIPKTIYVPYMFQKNRSNGSVQLIQYYTIYTKVVDPRLASSFTPTCPFSSAAVSHTGNAVDASNEIFDCFGKKLKEEERDDCSNYKLNTVIEATGQRAPAKMRVIYTGNVEGAREKSLVCCYQYGGYKMQYAVCNMPSKSTFNNMCQLGQQRSRMTGEVLMIHNSLMKIIDVQRSKGISRNLLRSNEGEIRDCLCKMDSSQPTQEELSKCKDLLWKPCDPKWGTTMLSTSFPICSGRDFIKWPNISSHRFLFHSLFVKKYNMWQVVKDRFRNSQDHSQKNKCPKDRDWEERFDPSKDELFDSFLEPIPAEKDDCGNYKIPTAKKSVNCSSSSMNLPRLVLIPEISMNMMDPTRFKYSKSVHCCYFYEYFPTQAKACNLQDPELVARRCHSKPRSAVRIRHELEFRRRYLALRTTTSALHAGRRVKALTPVLLSKTDRVWITCICHEKNDPNHSEHEDCRKNYLPPCIIPRELTNNHMLNATDTYDTCPSLWTRPGGPQDVRLPIMMKYTNSSDQHTFEKVPLFDVVNKCPDENSRPVISQPSAPDSTWIDCYGDDVSEKDDCGNPRVYTPDTNSLTSRVRPKKVLIAKDSLPDPTFANDDGFLCCYKYGISRNSDVDVCNMPSKDALQNLCNYQDNPETADALQKLKDIRRNGGGVDVMKNRQKRAKWTDCLCNLQNTTCAQLLL